MYCGGCGKQISSDAKFCPFCGTQSDRQVAIALARRGIRRSVVGIVISVITIVLIALIVLR